MFSKKLVTVVHSENVVNLSAQNKKNVLSMVQLNTMVGVLYISTT